MKINLSKKNIILFFIIFFIISTFLFILIHHNKNMVYTKSVIYDTQNIKAKIIYPHTNNNVLNKKIKKTINEKIENIKNQYKNDNGTYELNIIYETYKLNNLYTFYFSEYIISNDEKFENNYIIYYDYTKNEEIFITDIFYTLSYKEYIYTKNNLNECDLPYIIFGKNNLILKGTDYTTISYENIYYIMNYETNTINTEISVLNNEERVQTSLEELQEIVKDKKILFLTFDDGPSPKTTLLLLEELEKLDVRATFFLLGINILENENIVKELYLKGHTIGNHTYSHKNLNSLSSQKQKEEIDKTNELIKSIIQITPKYFRPPYGNKNNNTLSVTDMTFILWSVDTLDWQSRNADKVSNKIISNVKDGDIILLHDIYKSSVQGAVKAITKLQKEGYVFLSLEEGEKLNIIPNTQIIKNISQ